MEAATPTSRRSPRKDVARAGAGRGAKSRQRPGAATSRASISTRSCPAARSRRSRPSKAAQPRPTARSASRRGQVAERRRRSADEAPPPTGRRQARADKVASAEPPKARASRRALLAAGGLVRRREADAENLKARLALAGWEAASSRARCRTRGSAIACASGPTTTPTSSIASRASSRKRGFDVAVIKF